MFFQAPPTDPSPDGVEVAVVALEGELDMASVPDWVARVRDAESAQPTRLVLDCLHVDFIDSSGLSLLAGAQQRARQDGRELLLANVPRQMRRVLEVAGLIDLFSLMDQPPAVA